MTLDLLVRGGTVVDGTGAPRFAADVGIADGRIVEVGRITQSARQTLDADGLIVAPGFIDGHTHMDAQVAWDPLGSCSCWHGVTSVVMSNCGFTLAPCKPEDRQWYADCLSYVEDISTDAMAAGIDWNWETFPEYMAAVESFPKAINYGMYIGHSAVRMYVMGRRALTDTASPAEITRMAQLVQEGLRAGALGFSSSRTHTHMTPDGTPVASRIAGWDEIEQILAAMAAVDAGIYQTGPDISSRAGNREFLERMRHFTLTYKRPVMFGVVSTRQGEDPCNWRDQTDFIEATNAAGGRIFGQGTTRSINAIFSLKSYLPFDVLPAWKPLRALPLEEQKRGRQDPGWRCCYHRSAQARLRQPVCDEGGRLGRSHNRRARPQPRAASGGGHDRSLAGRRQPGLRATPDQRIPGRYSGHARARQHAGHLLRFRCACVSGDGLVVADALS
jgi:hypothetical protein